MEFSAAELRSLENARDSCCTLTAHPANSIYEPYRVHMILYIYKSSENVYSDTIVRK